MAHILVVDDSPTELHVIKGMLEKNGFHVTAALSGEEGVDIARKSKPDLVLMDVVMPGLNGFQATRLLARESDTSTIPIIMVTTKDQETDKVWGIRQGARDYIVKPVKEKDLVERVNSLLTS